MFLAKLGAVFLAKLGAMTMLAKLGAVFLAKQGAKPGSRVSRNSIPSNSIPSNSPAARPRFALIAIIVGTYFNDLVSLSLQGPFAYDNISVFVCLCGVQWFEYVFGHIEFMMCWTANI